MSQAPLANLYALHRSLEHFDGCISFVPFPHLQCNAMPQPAATYFRLYKDTHLSYGMQILALEYIVRKKLASNYLPWMRPLTLKAQSMCQLPRQWAQSK